MITKPTLNICMITYNHENYIREAIEGVLMQMCDFNIELIISNDYSIDSTDSVIQDILQNHPKASMIKYINHKRNLGMMPNFIQALEQCNGKYIALCEGDDYWTDPLKLQKQVDFLEGNPNYNICFHKVQLLKNGIIKDADDITIKRYDAIENFPVQLSDLLEQGNFIHTPSVVFRNQIINIPFEFEFSPVGDYFLYIILANQGFIKRLDDTMAVYRDGVGIYSILDDLSYKKNMLIYQSCILSYLNDNDKDQKGILLKRQIELINNHFNNIEKQIPSDEVLLKVIGIKKLFKLTFMKILKKLSAK